MKPMDRKGLEALVDAAYKKVRFDVEAPRVSVAVTDALWAEMVPTREWSSNETADTAKGRCSFDKGYSGQLCRILICTDEPAPTWEDDAVKLARKLRRMWSVDANGDLAFLAEILADADRILKEAPDA